MFRSFFEGFKVPFKWYWDAAYEQILELQFNANRLQLDYWLQTTVGLWYWWFLVFWSIFPLWVWWKYTQRTRFLEVSFFGVLTSISAGILDTAGAFFGLWAYPYSLPVFAQFLPY